MSGGGDGHVKGFGKESLWDRKETAKPSRTREPPTIRKKGKADNKGRRGHRKGFIKEEDKS